MKITSSDTLVPASEITKAKTATKELREKLKEAAAHDAYEGSYAFLHAPFDAHLREEGKRLKEVMGGRVRFLILIGIGGSNLTAKAVYDSMFGSFDLAFPRYPKLICLDTIHPYLLDDALHFLDAAEAPEEYAMVMVSKSGSTTETIGNAEIVLNAARERFGDAAFGRTVVIVEKGTPLAGGAEAHKMHYVPHENTVGGRFSAGSASGAISLALLGIDLEEFHKGARDGIKEALSKDSALHYATFLVRHYATGHSIHDLFFFDPYLETVGKWSRQLLAESLGKAESVSGAPLHVGITPTISMGSTDLHSVGQLTFGGPQDKTALFISTSNAEDIRIPELRVFPFVVPDIVGKSAGEIYAAIYLGTVKSYQKAGIPFMECQLDARSPAELGAFMYWQMIATVFAAKLLDINPFDQPSVEQYKTETRRILSEK